jgi:hypothetical protein
MCKVAFQLLHEARPYFLQFKHLITSIVTARTAAVAALPAGNKAANAGNDEHPDYEDKGKIAKPIRGQKHYLASGMIFQAGSSVCDSTLASNAASSSGVHIFSRVKICFI